MKINTIKKLKPAVWAAFAIYTAVMLWLLIFQRLFAGSFVSAELPDRFQFIPFRTVSELAEMLSAFSINDFAFRNIAGNIVLFIPIGIFLPVLFRSQRKFLFMLTTTVITICLIELIQALTALGTCDIDDLILNTAGACIGYLIFRLVSGRNKKDESSDPS